MQVSFLHIVRVDVDAEVEEAFNEWYDRVHIPAILACPGWLSAKRYVSIDEGPKYAAVYEVAGTWAYETPEYAEAKGFHEFTPAVHNFMRQRLQYLGAPSAEGSKPR